MGARNGGRSAPLALAPPGAPQLTVQLLPGGLLRGQVTSGGAPPPGATLELSPGDEPSLAGAGGLERELAGASFAFADLAPGAWQLTATTPDGRTGRATAAVAPGAETSVQVEVAPGGTISGRVVDAAGAPLAGAFVSAGRAPARPGGDRARRPLPHRRDRSGQGRHGAGLRASGSAAPSSTVELAAGQTLDLGDLAADRAGPRRPRRPLKGRRTRPSRRPVWGAAHLGRHRGGRSGLTSGREPTIKRRE